MFQYLHDIYKQKYFHKQNFKIYSLFSLFYIYDLIYHKFYSIFIYILTYKFINLIDIHYYVKCDKEIISTVADEFGYYEVEIDNKDIASNEPLTPVFTKVVLTQEEGQTIKVLASNNILGISSENTLIAKVFNFISSVFNKDKVLQDSPSVAGESIYIPPESLKGYIYDKAGNIVKNAQIDIILSMSDKVYGSIASDDNGYILVSNEYLPVFDYYLLARPEGQGAFKISMGEFLSGNK